MTNSSSRSVIATSFVSLVPSISSVIHPLLSKLSTCYPQCSPKILTRSDLTFRAKALIQSVSIRPISVAGICQSLKTVSTVSVSETLTFRHCGTSTVNTEQHSLGYYREGRTLAGSPLTRSSPNMIYKVKYSFQWKAKYQRMMELFYKTMIFSDNITLKGHDSEILF